MVRGEAMREARADSLFDPEYPDSDGQPMAENTLQYEWIVTLKGGLDVTVDDFVAGDLLWYPVRGQPTVRAAPDVMVVLGRPKGHRGSYRQWEEDNIAPAVVIEVLSPNNTVRELSRKLWFYEDHGVEEYLVFDPDAGRLEVRVRQGSELVLIATVGGWTSPLLGVTWSVVGKELVVTRPDGTVFESYETLHRRSMSERTRADTAVAQLEAERERADAQRERADAAEARLQALLASLGQDAG
jgi:Uma2 family endonuclease